MNEVYALLMRILDEPNDATAWLVLADWLEEHGQCDKAELLRLRALWADPVGDKSLRKKAKANAKAILREQPALVGSMHPFLNDKSHVFTEPSAFVLFLLAETVAVVPGALTDGTNWEGELEQHPLVFPTKLTLRMREGNLIEGDMAQDFTTMYGAEVKGTFYFRGVVVEPHIAFVTWRMEGAASGPGLYQFRIGDSNRWDGTWRLAAGRLKGKMWLKPKQSRPTRKKKSV